MQLLLLQLQAHSGAATGKAGGRQHHLQMQAVQGMVTCKPAASNHAAASASLRQGSSSRHSNMQMRVMRHPRKRMVAHQN
jgi:hypothetical protein